MSNLERLASNDEEIFEPYLPSQAFTRSGVSFDPTSSIWDWHDGIFRVHLNFPKLELPSTIPLDSLKRTLLSFAKNSSANHLCNLFVTFTGFLKRRGGIEGLVLIDAAEVSNYRASLSHSEKALVGRLNVLLQKWVALGLPGVAPDCTEYLREIRKPGNEKGAAVRTRDPIKGPFSEAEYKSLYKAADTSYGRGELSLWITLLNRLMFACGGRISQYASLKVVDVVFNGGQCVLRLPQVKTRDVHSRVFFKDFDISAQTGRMLSTYIESLAASGLGDQSALFPQSVVLQKASRVDTREETDLFWGHCQSKRLSSQFSSALSKISPPTDRLEYLPIPISPQRFRYTFGTRLAEEGASQIVIADRLGHADLQNVAVYFEASPKIIENIDKAMAYALAPLSQAFMGHLVEDELHSTLRGAPGSRIIDFRVSPKPVGSCAGCGSGCAFNKPVACYTCFKFEPWLDAPHQEVLLRLEEERERLLSDERLASINDDAICAVKEVMAEVSAALQQRRELSEDV